MGKMSKMWGSGIGATLGNLVMFGASYASGTSIVTKDALITWIVTTIGAMAVTYGAPKNRDG